MIFEKLQSEMRDENQNEFDKLKDYPTLADLMKAQNRSNDESYTVHHRRDLDSLG